MPIPIGSHARQRDVPYSPASMMFPPLRPAFECLLVVLCTTACSSETPDTEEMSAAAAETAAFGEARLEEAASVPTDRAGTLDLDGTAYTFLVVTCDLTGNSEAGMLLRGTGTAPDGRRLTAEVERLAPEETTHERASVYFGGIMDGDHWTARASGWPDGRWFAGEDGSEPVDGPLIRVSGNELTAEGAFRHERDGFTKTGKIHATCPG